MGEESYSRTQLLTLGTIIALTPALRLFPGQTAALAGRAAWLTAVGALPLGLAWLFLLSRLLRLRQAGENLPELALRLLGKAAGKAVVAGLGLWALLYAAFVLRAGADRLVGTVYPHSSPWVFALVMGALALAGALARPRSLVRMARLLRPLLLGILGVLFVFALPGLRLDNLWPITVGDLLPALKGTLPALDIYSGAALALCFLVGGTKETPGGFRALAAWVLGICVILTALSLAVTGSFGAELAATLARPFFALVRTLVFFRTVERVEALVVTLWIFPDFLCASLFLWAGQYCLRLLLGQNPRAPHRDSLDLGGGRWLIPLCAVAVTGLAILLAPQPQQLERWSRQLIPAINLALCFTLVPVLYIVGRKKQS